MGYGAQPPMMEPPPQAGPEPAPAGPQPSAMVEHSRPDASLELAQAVPAMEFLGQALPALAPILTQLLQALSSRIQMTPEAAQQARQEGGQQFSTLMEAGVFLEVKLGEIAAKRPDLEQPIQLAVEAIRDKLAQGAGKADQVPTLSPPEDAVQERSARMLP